MLRAVVIVLLSVIGLLALPYPSYAQILSKPTYLQDIVDPPGPIPNRVVKDPQVAGIAPWGFSLSFASEIAKKVFDITGVSFTQKHTIKVPNVGEDGAQIEFGAVGLVSKALQKACIKLITYPQHMTANHRNCHYDEDGGGSHVPSREILGNQSPGLHKLRGGTEILATLVTNVSRSCAMLDLYNTEVQEVVAPENGLPCDTQTGNLFHTGLYEAGTSEHEYEEGHDPFQATANLLCSPQIITDYFQCRFENSRLPPEEQIDCSFDCNIAAHTVYSTLWSGAEQMMEHLVRGEDGECNGITCAFLPNAIQLTRVHGTNEEIHEIDLANIFSGLVTSEKAVYYMLAQEKEGMAGMNCSNMSKAQRIDLDPDKKCEFAIVGPGSIPPGPTVSNIVTETPPNACIPDEQGSTTGGNTTSSPGSVGAAAQAAGIPDCVLNAVYAMESASGALSSCTPNVCGAVGPFAITVGYTGSNQGGQCSQDTTCSQCAAGYCPNAIEGTGLTAADMCDTGKAAAFAARLLKGKAGYFGENLTGTDGDIAGSVDLQDAIIAAGNSYFGSNFTFSEGQNIEPGCSYGESILVKYCGFSGYTCGGDRNLDVSQPPGPDAI